MNFETTSSQASLVVSIKPFAQYLNKDIKDIISKNSNVTKYLDSIAEALLYFKNNARLFDTEHIYKFQFPSSNREQSENIDIIDNLLFRSDVSYICIDAIYDILGHKLLHYDDDDYCDDIIHRMEKVISDSDDWDDYYITHLVIIANALLNYELFN